MLYILEKQGSSVCKQDRYRVTRRNFRSKVGARKSKKRKAKLLDARRSFARAEPHPGFAMFVAKFAHGAIGELFNLYQPHFDRVTNQAGHVVNIKPLHQLRPVRFDSLDTDVQGETYVFGAVPFGDER